MASIIQPKTPPRVRTTKIPFVPAYDLLEQQEAALSDEEVVQIALALHLLLPELPAAPTSWKESAKLDAVSRLDLS